MIAYFDSSALVKLVVDEQGSDDAEALWNAAAVIVTSRLAHPEVCSALASAERDGRLRPNEHSRALRSWDELSSSLDVIELAPSVAVDAGSIAYTHRLTGGDAVHLASARTIPAADLVFATWDRRLLTAAREDGLDTLTSPGDESGSR